MKRAACILLCAFLYGCLFLWYAHQIFGIKCRCNGVTHIGFDVLVTYKSISIVHRDKSSFRNTDVFVR